MKLLRWLVVPATALTLGQGRVHEVQVAPAAATITVGATQRLRAMAYDAGGNVVMSGVRYAWSSNNVNVARVDSLGTVTGVAAGSAVIRAEALGSGAPNKSGAAAITVRRAE